MKRDYYKQLFTGEYYGSIYVNIRNFRQKRYSTLSYLQAGVWDSISIEVR